MLALQALLQAGVAYLGAILLVLVVSEVSQIRFKAILPLALAFRQASQATATREKRLGKGHTG